MGVASSRGRDEMADAAGEPSAKRAKGDEAKEEEDPLVRRREEVIRLLERASAKGKVDARAKEELLSLCTRLEAKNEKNLTRLPPELWQKILDENVLQNDLLALAMTCRFFREKQKDLGWKLKTDLRTNHFLDLQERGKMASHSLGWFRWVCDTFEILPGYKWSWHPERVKGAVNEGNLVNYAAFQGCVEILRWLMEEKGWEPNKYTTDRAGMGGSVEVLEYVRGRGYKFDKWTCARAAQAGRLEALQYLRGLDPPCRWDSTTCSQAACRGHLQVLKWARSQDPPCPWIKSDCRWDASHCGKQHIVQWIDQQEDESDVEYREYSDSDSDRSYDSYGDEYF
ncbi:hypothetical protein HKI87_15g81450 [Chloropicon roscoffensis]|uniref:F-box domain-containing protein n=1 Tax=Chloropicon roscoffensis TaxID=1461544 RepID=A0AAX4PJV5_9CHLO